MDVGSLCQLDRAIHQSTEWNSMEDDPYLHNLVHLERGMIEFEDCERSS